MFKVVLFDVDSTLINEEVIDLLALESGHGKEVAEITHRAMSGELNFDQALRERVSLLQGLPETVFLTVAGQISFTKGALELIAELKRRTIAVGIVSGGFHNILDDLLLDLDLSFLRANTLEVEAGKLTGRTIGPIINRKAKATALMDFAQQQKVELLETVAIGDGANDIEMIQLAGLGISFCGKDVLNQAADVSIKDRDLLQVLNYLA